MSSEIASPLPPRAPPPRLEFGAEEREEARWLIQRALSEDIPSGDVTTDALFPMGGRAVWLEAAFVARAPGVLCGLPVVREIFEGVDGRVELRALKKDGDHLDLGETFLEVTGPARTVLRLERITLNFLQRLSGIATTTRRFVEALAGTPARLLDTRKTTPGWRRLEKYAVRAGGGTNHRMSLSDEALLKDNHAGALRAVGRGSIGDWVLAIRRAAGAVFLEVEVGNRNELLEALEAGVDCILLDNMPPSEMRWAVEARDARAGGSGRSKGHGTAPLLEASGGLRLETVREAAAAGVDRVSVGALTHSAAALDIALDTRRAFEASVS
ncbi:MAG TPA: carboxylating nicotinate-nucleotide diphosphorylase [Planctomycetota bacterium]|nr:carboxylating nicotinate-nucleotide diphosphorylase [Planctomycetota bacterium]